MEAIAFHGVRLALDGHTVLTNASLRIAQREFIGVLGPNGAGKTTLLRAILGLVRPEHGSVRVLGRPASRGNPAIGYLPQRRELRACLGLRGRDVIASAVRGHLLGLPVLGNRGRREVDRVLDLVGARELARQPLGEMSGGERQRLQLALALLGKPQLLLLDEPLASLDPRRQHEAVALVRSLQCELGIAVLFCSHELDPLLGALDRVLYLGRGQIALGTPDEVLTGPVLSHLYGTPMEVTRIGPQRFVITPDRNGLGSCAPLHGHAQSPHHAIGGAGGSDA